MSPLSVSAHLSSVAVISSDPFISYSSLGHHYQSTFSSPMRRWREFFSHLFQNFIISLCLSPQLGSHPLSSSTSLLDWGGGGGGGYSHSLLMDSYQPLGGHNGKDVTTFTQDPFTRLLLHHPPPPPPPPTLGKMREKMSQLVIQQLSPSPTETLTQKFLSLSTMAMRKLAPPPDKFV